MCTGEYALSIVIFIVRSSQQRGHRRGQATRDYMVTSMSRRPKLASLASYRRRKERGPCWSRREMSLLFGSAVFFFCGSIVKSALAVLFKIAFSFRRKRIRVRFLNAERKISYCLQDDFTRFFKFSSVKETIRQFKPCRK